jgi:hypothetical protein
LIFPGTVSLFWAHIPHWLLFQKIQLFPRTIKHFSCFGFKSFIIRNRFRERGTLSVFACSESQNPTSLIDPEPEVSQESENCYLWSEKALLRSRDEDCGFFFQETSNNIANIRVRTPAGSTYSEVTGQLQIACVVIFQWLKKAH